MTFPGFVNKGLRIKSEIFAIGVKLGSNKPKKRGLYPVGP